MAELNGKASGIDRLDFPLNKHGLSKRQGKHLEQNMPGMKISDEISTHLEKEWNSLHSLSIVGDTSLLNQREWAKGVCSHRQRYISSKAKF